MYKKKFSFLMSYGACSLLLLVSLSIFPASVHAAISFVGYASNSHSNSQDSLSITVPVETTTGDILIAQVAVRGNTTMSAPAGWTLVLNSATTNLRQSIYYRFVDGTEPSAYQWNFSRGDRAGGAISAFRGVDGSNPLIDQGSLIGSGNNITAPSVTTTVDNAWLVTLYAGAGSNTAITLPISMDSFYSETTGAGPNGLAFAAAGELRVTAGATGLRIATGANTQNIGHSIALRPASLITCYTDDFNRSALGGDWTTRSSSGSFGAPRIVNGRLRLTDNSSNVATVASLMRLFPGANNLVTIEFTHYAYNGNGADGIALTFSDAAVTPQPGGYGGSLGYAQRCGIPGFAGGWLGIGIDEYGNFINRNECRGWSPYTGRVLDSVVARGSGNGMDGYVFLRGTTTSLNPGVDAPSSNVPAPGHRYRILVDHTSGGAAMVSVERDTGSGYQYLPNLDPFNIFSVNPTQADVPENWLISLTGSTGGSTNIHEIDNLQVCALRMDPYETPIDHFRFIRQQQAGLTCNPMDIQVRACLDTTCSQEYDGPITATFSPSGWEGGNTKTGFSSGAGFNFRHTTPGTITLGVTSSIPATRPFSQPRCYVGGTQQASCNVLFRDAGFVFNVPDHAADTVQSITLSAVRKDENSQLCVPGFENETKAVHFWTNYSDPTTGTLPVQLNGAPIPDQNPSGAINLQFNQHGQAVFSLRYADVGQIILNALYLGSADEDGLVMNGDDSFVSRPVDFLVSVSGNPAAADANGAAFLAAGENFEVLVTAVNAAGAATPNYGRENAPESVAFDLTLFAPAGGQAPDLAGSLGIFGQNCQGNPAASGTACGLFNWPEVGIIQITPRIADGNYLGAGNVLGTPSSRIGRFVPHDFAVAPVNGALQSFCGNFSYTGQPISYEAGSKPGYIITARATGGTTTRNYTGAFMKLSPAGVSIGAVNTDHSMIGAQGTLTSIIRIAGIADLADNGDGTLNYSFGDDSIIYLKNANARISPYVSDLRLAVNAVTDSDAVQAGGLPQTANPDGVELQFARLRIDNAYGPELLDLTTPMVIESYAAGNYYAVNTLDNCTSLDLSADFTFDTGGLSSSPGPGTPSFNQGTSALTFSAPGAGNTGSIGISTSFGAYYPWLLYDWDGDSLYDDEAQARATFGIYQGNPRKIFTREILP